ncbi:MAG: aminoacetone oxidase family FAD-binding enzyme [Rikenellaceae bacterium]|nr:aminoacetone oxidase family FAD-binding enzyme [Rikenellaceae bacterium]MCL2691830.1 aminoacetone oxidase family FAD-binding enzyme [Rikenellaceae bacterium]
MYDVIVIGAGAAGMMAAGVAARAGRRVLVVEKMEKTGRKIRISGKGRCNVTNTKPREEFLEHVRANAAFFEPSLRSFDNRAVPSFFRKLGVKLVEERGDRLYPESGKAWDVADALADWAKDEGDCEIMLNTRVVGLVVVAGRVRGVRIVTKKGYPRNIEAANVIIATGGVSYPLTGSTGDGYLWAHDAGHRIEEVRPALVPLVAGGDAAAVVQKLVGVHLKNVAVQLVVDDEVVQEEFGEMDFTGRGLDGAVVLRVSRRAVDALIDGRTVELVIDLKSALTPEMLAERIEREIADLPEDGTCGELMRKLLPRPMVEPFAEMTGIRLRDYVSRLTDEQRGRLIALLKEWRLPVADYRPFEEAIVTAGGVSCEDVDPETLQSRRVRGLYFAGEVLDIDGDTGGYNIQIALSTGSLAGRLKE